MNSNGNFGIGTAAPTQRLHVDGGARLTGRFYDAGNSPGSAGQVLSATASGTDWITLPSASPIKAFGKVNANVSGVGLSGATSQKLSDGRYRITFSSAMANANYVIQLTQSSFGGSGNDAPSITYTNEGTSSFEVIITDSDNGVSDGRRVDGEFMFTVISL